MNKLSAIFILFVIFTFAGLNLKVINAYIVPEGAYRNDMNEIPIWMNKEEKEIVKEDDEDGIWMTPGKRDMMSPYISVGILSNLQEFFDGLKSNMGTLEENEQALHKDVLYGKPTGEFKGPYAGKISHKIRNYIESPMVKGLKGTNQHKPSYLYTGIGKRSVHKNNRMNYYYY